MSLQIYFSHKSNVHAQFCCFLFPNLDEGSPEDKVSNPGCQGFERRVGRIRPVCGNLIFQEACVDAVHLL